MAKNRKRDWWYRKPKWVCAYEVTRQYGGPEEGGWWYNHHEPLEAQTVTKKSASRIKARLEKKFGHLAHGDIYSVLGGKEVTVYIEQRRFQSAGGWHRYE